MRTTLTIDDELLHKLREEAARTRRRVRDVLNDRLRLGYAREVRPKQVASKFVVKPFATKGFAPGSGRAKAQSLLDVLEIEQSKTVIIPDLNLLLYAHNPGAAAHFAAKPW